MASNKHFSRASHFRGIETIGGAYTRRSVLRGSLWNLRGLFCEQEIGCLGVDSRRADWLRDYYLGFSAPPKVEP